MNLPVRLRLTLWYVALLAAILAAVGAFLVLRLRADLTDGLDRSLSSRAAQIVLAYQGGQQGAFQDVADAALPGGSPGESAAQVLDRAGRVLQSSGDPVAERRMLVPAALAAARRGGRVRLSAPLDRGRESFRLLVLPLGQAPTRQVLVVASSLEEVEGSVHRLLMLILLAGPAALLAAAVGGYWLARRALRPVARMTETAEHIGAEREGERVPVPQAADELRALALTLNAMLERLQRGVEDKRRLVADASHELRTPLTNMRTELEVSLGSPGLASEARGVLESTREEVERMSRVVEDLLVVAQSDEGRLELARGPASLREVAGSALAALGPLAERRGVRLEMAEGADPRVEADVGRLERVAVNLVENAVKHTAPGGSVRVSVWGGDGQAGLSVADQGPGIPAETLPRVFERFFRLDAVGGRGDGGGGGSGLGLAICREIVEAHGGRIWAMSTPGEGTVFSFALPAAPGLARPSP